MSSYIIKEPKTNDEFKLYYNFRWELLRKPYDQIEGSEKDKYENKAYHLMVINLSNKVIGVGRLHKTENELGNVCAQIRYMAVSKDFQKKGLGTKILTNLEKYAFNDNVSEIMLHSRENAIDFYKKNGYEVIKKTHILYNSIQHWLMSKKII